MNHSTLQHAAELLRSRGVVVFPTETVYGLGANALDPLAVARVFEIKGRPRFDPLIVHVPHPDALDDLVAQLPPAARTLAAQFWPGPLTLVLPKTTRVPDIVTAGLPSVAVRIPDHPIALELLLAAQVPVAAPSANRFGHISPTTAQHVRDELGSAVDLILDGGPCRAGIESTVLSLLEPTPTLLRPGATPVEALEAVIGPIARPSPHTRANLSPGMLDRHYAPRTPLRLLDPGQPIPTPLDAARHAHLPEDTTVALLALSPIDPPPPGFALMRTLCDTGDLRTAAAALFAAMRQLDDAGVGLILAVPAPEHDLGLAINDRLRRASHR